jgi:mannose-1-phosphate guanylyltransferase
MTNVILCGGSGTRLWPISRKLMPKQFVKLFNDNSLFQLTVKRNSKLCDKQFIVSNAEQYFLAMDQLEELNKEHTEYLLEPIGRNTAPAIALACFALDENELVLVTPSDHLIKNEKEYEKVLQKAKEEALKNNLVTFGITPTFAETGFGYIEAKKEDNKDIFNVKKFHEKPDLKTAEIYLKAGNYYWNSGMFMFKAGVFLEELQKYSPEIYESAKIAFDNKQMITDNQIRIKHEFMAEIPENSIDYTVMEKSKIVKVIPANIDWSDVGSFDALIKECKSNVEYYEEDSKNNFYYSDNNKKVIATIGVEDFIIVDTKDALLITKKGQSQKVKNIVNKLKDHNNELLTTHYKVHRPWGTFETLIDDNGYKIKRIVVKPGKRLSLQKHYHRNEHWIVVSGTAKVQVGDKHYLVRPNESTYIKMGEIHRLSNPGKIPVVLIEAQVGEYTGEDDIVRIEDDFKRN